MMADRVTNVLLPNHPQKMFASRGIAVLLVVIDFLLMAGCRDRSPIDDIPARIVSGSMAEQFWGEHWQVTCNDCGYEFRCGVEHPPDDAQALCPNCGYQKNKIDFAQSQQGKSVVVVPRDFTEQPPRRWEVIAFKEPGVDYIALKRVAGLPGERLAIRNGDLFNDEKRIQKSLSEFHRVAQTVHVDAHRPLLSRGLPRRWQAVNPDGTANLAWASQRTFVFNPQFSQQPAEPNWLNYQQWRCSPLTERRTEPAAILDNYAYNQSLSRQLNHAGNVAIAGQFVLSVDSEVRLSLLYCRSQLIQVVMTPSDSKVNAYVDDQLLASEVCPQSFTNSPQIVQAAICDGRLLVGLRDEEEMLVCELPAATAGKVEFFGEPAIAIGARGGTVTVGELKISRDVYYLNPHHRPDDWEMEHALGEGEYFLLGDNPPNSRDSRHYGAISLGEMVGAVQFDPSPPNRRLSTAR